MSQKLVSIQRMSQTHDVTKKCVIKEGIITQGSTTKDDTTLDTTTKIFS